jgi:hypothetical protein
MTEITTVKFQFPYFTGYPTESQLPPQSFDSEVTLTTPAGTVSVSKFWCATVALAEWVAAMLGGKATTIDLTQDQVHYNKLKNVVVLPNGGIIDPAIVGQCFVHGSYFLTAPDTGKPETTGANIADMVMNICAGAGWLINLELTVAPAPPQPASSTAMVGQPFGPGRYRFGTGTVAALNEGDKSQISNIAPLQVCNAWNGMQYTAEESTYGTLIAVVFPSIFPNQFSGFWVQIAPPQVS